MYTSHKKLQQETSQSIKSIVFPRNEVNKDYFDILIENGFTHFRGNPDSFFYSKGHRRFNLPVRLLRLLDS